MLLFDEQVKFSGGFDDNPKKKTVQAITHGYPAPVIGKTNSALTFLYGVLWNLAHNSLVDLPAHRLKMRVGLGWLFNNKHTCVSCPICLITKHIGEKTCNVFPCKPCRGHIQ